MTDPAQGAGGGPRSQSSGGSAAATAAADVPAGGSGRPYFTSDFANAREEWKRVFAEIVGTFGLVLVAAGVPALAGAVGMPHSAVAAAVAPGLVVMALIYALAEVSGAHFNPAVTVAFALRGAFPWKRVPAYVLGQLVGAIAAAGLLAVFGPVPAAAATLPGAHVSALAAVLMEATLTAMLIIVILGTASNAKIVGHNAAIAVGALIAVAGLVGGPVTGGSMNPARSFGIDVVRLHFASSWIYIVGPLLGAFVAVAVARVLRGPTGPGEVAAAGGEGEDDADRA